MKFVTVIGTLTTLPGQAVTVPKVEMGALVAYELKLRVKNPNVISIKSRIFIVLEWFSLK